MDNTEEQATGNGTGLVVIEQLCKRSNVNPTGGDMYLFYMVPAITPEQPIITPQEVNTRARSAARILATDKKAQRKA